MGAEDRKGTWVVLAEPAVTIVCVWPTAACSLCDTYLFWICTILQQHMQNEIKPPPHFWWCHSSNQIKLQPLTSDAQSPHRLLWPDFPTHPDCCLVFPLPRCAVFFQNNTPGFGSNICVLSLSQSLWMVCQLADPAQTKPWFLYKPLPASLSSLLLNTFALFRVSPPMHVLS